MPFPTWIDCGFALFAFQDLEYFLVPKPHIIFVLSFSRRIPPSCFRSRCLPPCTSPPFEVMFLKASMKANATTINSASPMSSDETTRALMPSIPTASPPRQNINPSKCLFGKLSARSSKFLIYPPKFSPIFPGEVLQEFWDLPLADSGDAQECFTRGSIF